MPLTGLTLPPYTPPVITPHTVGAASTAMTTPLGGVRGNKVMGFTASDLPSSTTSSITPTLGKAGKGKNGYKKKLSTVYSGLFVAI